MLIRLTGMYLELLNLRRFKKRIKAITERVEREAGVDPKPKMEKK